MITRTWRRCWPTLPPATSSWSPRTPPSPPMARGPRRCTGWQPMTSAMARPRPSGWARSSSPTNGSDRPEARCPRTAHSWSCAPPRRPSCGHRRRGSACSTVSPPSPTPRVASSSRRARLSPRAPTGGSSPRPARARAVTSCNSPSCDVIGGLAWSPPVGAWRIHDHGVIVERTLDAIAVTYPDQVDGYRRYLADALPLARLVLDTAREVPTRRALIRMAGQHRGRGAARALAWGRRTVAEVLSRYFTAEQVIAPAVTTGPGVWGLSPFTPGTGMGALVYAMKHVVRAGRPVGGSGAL